MECAERLQVFCGNLNKIPRAALRKAGTSIPLGYNLYIS